VEANHKARGYGESFYGSHIAYHFIVGLDGTVKQNRPLDERTMHTKNAAVNNASIAIVLAGNTNNDYLPSAQLDAARALVKRLDSALQFERIIAHRDASPTGCPGKWALFQLEDLFRNRDLGTAYKITRYYSPQPDQLVYFMKKTYLQDVEMNCGLNKDGTAGDCSTTANGYKLKPEDAFKVAACPPDMPFGTMLYIMGIGEVKCVDRGGAIKDKRIDVWAGYGMDGLRNIARNQVAGILSVQILD